MSTFKVLKATKINKRVKIEEIETILVPEAREYFYEKIEKPTVHHGYNKNNILNKLFSYKKTYEFVFDEIGRASCRERVSSPV